MDMPLATRSPAYPWALTGIFAAFHLVVSLLPYTPAGAGLITWGMVSAALIGLILGPLYGVISVGIGSVLTMIAFPSVAVISIFTPLAPMAGALTAGALVTRRPWIVYGLFGLTILLFVVGPIGLAARGFLWLHYVTLVFSFFYAIPGISGKLRNGLALSNGTSIAVVGLAYWFTGFCALMADSLVGSALWQYYAISIGYDVATLGGIYIAIMFVYPVERGLASIVLAVIAIATGRAMASAHLGLPLVGHRAEEQVKLLRTE
ncbi:MAG: hypothetical protein C4K47_08190 [Candidatus Thorarchaeota archaeon]|nr:MAG: hypothetical protein C4K47_08190 [Candidatus Thorarchaeota archaeon]